MNSSDASLIADLRTIVNAGRATPAGQDQFTDIDQIPLKPAASGERIGATSGVGRMAAVPGSSAAAVKGPFVEPTASTRQWHPDQVYTTPDGVDVLVLQPLKRVYMVDGDNNPIPYLEFAEPTPA